MPQRNIIKINQSLCNGCRACIGPRSGALVLENGKVKVVNEELCDGAGLCIAECPEGALEIEVREAPSFLHQAIPSLNEIKDGVNCLICGSDDEKVYPIESRKGGSSWWVCTSCLPRLIHG